MQNVKDLHPVKGGPAIYCLRHRVKLNYIEYQQKSVKMGIHPSNKQIVISPAQRLLENGHIFLWLVKDTCWVNEWKTGGLLMIAPTLGVAFFILWRTRRIKSELFHNLAICLWISGNSIWMTGEFFKLETRPYASLFFVTGLACMLYYYCFILPREKREQAAAVIIEA